MRKTKASKEFRHAFGHTHSVMEEEIPWKCRRLVIGTGAYGRLPVMDEVRREAVRRKIKLLILPTAQAIEALQQDSDKTDAILHITCCESLDCFICLGVQSQAGGCVVLLHTFFQKRYARRNSLKSS